MQIDKIYLAIQAHRLDKFTRRLERHKQAFDLINHRNEKGQTLLSCAIEHSALDIITTLLDKYKVGITAPMPGTNSLTYFMFACKLGDVEVVQLLLERDTQGYLANRQDVNGRTALMYAIIANQVDVVSFLLTTKHKIPIAMRGVYAKDGRDAMGYALDVACPKQDFTMPALLVEYGYPIVIKSWTQCRFFLPAMLVAVVYHNYTKAAKFLYTTYIEVLGEYVDMVDGFVLQQCIVQNNIQLCTQLCAMGIPLLRADGLGTRLLCLAVLLDNQPMVLQLIEFGAVLNFANVTTEHRSPLILAIELYNLAMVQALLQHGADVNMSESIHGNTPLHLAIMTRQFQMILLLKKQPGVNFSLKNKMGQSVQEALDALLTATTPDTYLKSLLDASDEPSRTDAGQDGVVVSNNGESSGEVGKSTQQDVPTVETPSQPVPSDDISIPILHCHLPQPIMKQYQSLLQYLMAMSKQKKELSIYKELLDINKWVQQQLGQPQEEMAMVVFSQKKLDFQRLTLSSNHTGTTNSANATSVPATNTGATASASQASSSKATAITATSKVEEKAGAILQTLTNFLEDYINYLWDVENEGNQVDALEAAEELQQALKKLPYTELCLKEWDAKVAKMAAEEAEREISDDEKNVSDEVHNIADALEMKLAHFCFEKSIKVMKGMVHKVAQHHLIQVPTLAMDTLPFLVELEDHVDEVMSVDSTRGAINAVDNEKQKASKAYISQLISQTQMPQPQQPQSQFGKAKAKGKINAITTVTANAANKSNKNVTAATTAPSVSSSVAPLPLPFPNQAKPIDTTAAASGAAQKTVSGGKIAPSTSITPLPVPIVPSTQSPTRVSTKPSIETTPLAVATRRTPLLPKSIEPYPQGEVDVNVGMLYFHEEDDEDILVDVKTSSTPSAKTKETVDTADDDSLTIVMMSANKKRSQPSSANRVVVGSGGGNEHTFTIVENNEEMNSPSQKKLKV